VPYARAYLDAIDDDDADREDIRAASDWLVLCYDAELPDPWQPEEVLGSLRLAERWSRGAEMYERILREVHLWERSRRSVLWPTGTRH
jgi:hypothetical protein